MNFLKKLWSAIKVVATNVLEYVAGPVLPFVNRVMGKTEGTAFNGLHLFGLVARVIWLASCFITVPAVMLAMATSWLILALWVRFFALCFQLAAVVNGGEFQLDLEDSAAKQDLAATAETVVQAAAASGAA